MSFRHTINGTEVSEPKEWNTFEQEIVRDFERRTISIKYPGSTTFTLGGYRMLRDMFVADDCGIVEYECTETCGDLTLLVVRANIILADCKWNLNRCEVECSLVDDGVDARITNNRGIPISPLADRSKNDTPITPVTGIAVEVFDTVNGNTLGTRTMFDWLACMQHAVQYMTDGNITLQSNWYNSLPDSERYAITTGYQLRAGDTSQTGTRVVYKFEELFLEVAKKYNLWLAIRRDTSGTPVVRIEREVDSFTDTVAASFEWTDNLIQSVDRDQLWARVDVGSDNAIKNQDAVQSLPFLVLQGFSVEEFHFETECNTDAVLDLVNNWGICTNLIQAVLDNDTGYEEDTFIIQYNRTTDEATMSDWYNPGGDPVLYNEALMNINVLNRYDLPSNIGSFYDALDAGFEAQRVLAGTPVTDVTTTPTTGTYAVAPFPAIILDPGGNYTPNDYTAPAQGYYVFEVRRQWRITENTFPVVLGNVQKRAISRIRIERYNSFNVLQNFTEFESSGQLAQAGLFTPPGNYQHSVTHGLVLNAGDYVRVQFRFDFTSSFDPLATGSITVLDQPGSIFGTSFVATGGGVITNIDPDAARIITYDFDRITTAARWKALTDNPTLAIEVAPDADLKLGHVKSAKRNIYRGTTTYTLICKRSQK
jgi:hypothetical protein